MAAILSQPKCVKTIQQICVFFHEEGFPVSVASQFWEIKWEKLQIYSYVS